MSARTQPRFDIWLFLIAALLTVVGLVFVFDAGYARSIASGLGLIPREFRGQLVYGAFGIVLGLVVWRIPLVGWKRLAIPIGVVSMASLILVKFIGTERNGAQRWIDIGPFDLQPSEFAKLAAVLFLALVLATYWPTAPLKKRPRDTAEALDKIWLPKLGRAMLFAPVLVAVVLIEMEPDLGTAAVIGATAFLMMILAGVSRGSIVCLALLAVGGAVFLAKQEPYRMERILTHTERWSEENVAGIGYQPVHSEAAMAQGGLTGVQLGNGRAKHVLPAATTDYILATIAEETGLIGSLAVLGLLGALVARLWVLARRAASRFGSLVLGGCACWIAVQSCTNVMMSNGTLPSIGIPLPFISSGGSSLIALWLAIGLCQAAAAERPVQVREEEAEHAASHHRWRDRRARLSRA